ncbi:MAG: tRNA (adenosine(37)-N6)-threonylcarbamoyltransferase complex dimerization subunit type 1 TsaB [Candidatus Zixiibacteriota bacterium]|nr:MAG: tRNA (adenosine(37)-N6)-threonylcarbamoyltransferase complex dimerization subunit type 1 TsaB [candidate division Zixibacteria bacterium]
MTDNLKKNVLAIDTSSSELKLGLSFGGDRMVKSCERVEKSHGRLVIKKIGELFQSAGLNKAELQAIVVCTGPGSFTGLRIGLAAAKGMAVALNIPVAGVNLFEVAAYKLRSLNRKVKIIIGLNRDECFVAPVESGSYEESAVSVVAYGDLLRVVGEDWVAGIRIDLSTSFPQLDSVDVSKQLDYDASDLLELGVGKLASGLSDDLAQLEPLYLQKSQAELRFERRQRKQ